MKFFYLLLVFVIAITGCGKDDEESGTTQTESVKILSNSGIDGYVINSDSMMVKKFENHIDMGWVNVITRNHEFGAATRGFLSFNILNIQPTSDKKLVVEKALLKVYEKNTNMLPFTGEGVDRVVEVYSLNYGITLDTTDFDINTIEKCGIIATTGYNVLEEYTLDVTQPVKNIINQSASNQWIQFRLQFTNNENVDASSTLSDAMWSIYSGEDQSAFYNAYRPVLVIDYHWEKK